MTLEQVRSSISHILYDQETGAEFYFLLRVQGEFKVKKADIDGTAQEELEGTFKEKISESLLLDDDLSLIDLSSADDRSDVIYRYDLQEVPEQIGSLTEVIERDDFELFDFNVDSLRDLKAIIVLIGSDEDQIVLYKHLYPVELLKQDTGLFVWTRNENRIGKVTDDILRINGNFEVFKVAGEYYIVNLKTLEKFFGFHEAIMNVAREGLENVAESGLIHDPSVLEARIEDVGFARKLVKAARGSPVLGKIPNDAVVEFVSHHPALRGKIGVTEDGAQLLLTTKRSQNLFLKLLNDDFLQSELTERYYASVAKDPVEE